MWDRIGKDAHMRAGLFGTPFCVIGWFTRHEPIFLLGGGFFASLIMTSGYKIWRLSKAEHLAGQTKTSSKELL